MTLPTSPQKLSVFLCHAQEDKPKVLELYERLNSESWIDPWLSDEKLLPGQEWEMEIVDALRNAHVIIVCLSRLSIGKTGHVQKEIKQALDISEQKPEGTIFIIPFPFDDCDIPVRLQKYHWVGYSSVDPYSKLLLSLEKRAIKLKTPAGQVASLYNDEHIELYRFIKIAIEEFPYTFYLSKYPVTNTQYQRFLKARDSAFIRQFWSGFPKFNEDCIQIGQWGNEGWDWMQNKMKGSGIPPKPDFWDNKNFGFVKLDNPVVSIKWFEANAYCKWLMHHWHELDESRANPELDPKQIRLPLELEWSVAAGGETPESRYPWDKVGKTTKVDKEIARRANVNGNIGSTTPVNAYLRGASPYKVMDMAGNVWEWQANFYDKEHKGLALRGGAWNYYQFGARVSRRYTYLPDDELLNNVGFRVICTV